MATRIEPDRSSEEVADTSVPDTSVGELDRGMIGDDDDDDAEEVEDEDDEEQNVPSIQETRKVLYCFIGIAFVIFINV